MAVVVDKGKALARKAWKALPAAVACGLAVGRIQHEDSLRQTAAMNRQADAAFEQAKAARDQVDAANRGALCSDASHAGRLAVRAKRVLDPDTKKLVAWCMERSGDSRTTAAGSVTAA